MRIIVEFFFPFFFFSNVLDLLELLNITLVIPFHTRMRVFSRNLNHKFSSNSEKERRRKKVLDSFLIDEKGEGQPEISGTLMREGAGRFGQLRIRGQSARKNIYEML